VKLVEITWKDSGMAISDGWKPIEAMIERAKEHGSTVQTVGLFAYEDDEMVAVGLSRDTGDESILGLQIIHKSNILSRRELVVVASTESE